MCFIITRLFQEYLDLSNKLENQDNILNIIKIFGFYSNFIKTLQSDKFNLQNINNLNIGEDKIDSKIIDHIINQINYNIQSFRVIKEEDKVLNIITQTVNCIKTFSQLTNNLDFMEKYKEKLVERLINNYDYNIENKLLNSFNFNSNMDQYVEMKLMIDDIFQSRELDKFIQTNTKINLTSEKYKDMKLSDVKVTSKVLSEDLWKNMKPTYNIMNIDKTITTIYHCL
jgi:hypothetical protein